MKLYKIIYWVFCAEGFPIMGDYKEFSLRQEIIIRATSKPKAKIVAAKRESSYFMTPLIHFECVEPLVKG